MGFGQLSELWDTGEGDDVRLGIEVPLVVGQKIRPTGDPVELLFRLL